jgi:hypothetical protein
LGGLKWGGARDWYFELRPGGKEDSLGYDFD